MGKHVLPKEKNSAAEEKLRQLRSRLPKTGVIKSIPESDESKLSYAAEAGILAAAFAASLIIWLLPFHRWVRTALSLIPLYAAGVPCFKKAWADIRGLELLSPEFILSCAALAVLLLGKCIEAVALMGVRRLCRMLKKYIQSIEDETAERFLKKWPEDDRDIKPGSVITVPAGTKIPADGIVAEGMSSIDTYILTGDAPVITAAPGSEVASGSVNSSGELKITAVRSYERSFAARLKEAVKNAAEERPKISFLLERVADIYTTVTVLLAIAIAIAPSMATGNWSTWIARAAIFLIASDPAALLFSVSLPYFGTVYTMADEGVYIKQPEYIELLAKVNTFVFEKSEVITDGEFIVTEVHPNGVREEELVALAAAAESESRHPIARAIRNADTTYSSVKMEIGDVKEFPGKGVCATVDGHRICVGIGVFLEANGIDYSVPSKPGTAIHVASDENYLGYMLVADKVRIKAFDALEMLRNSGVSNLVMLTGDVRSSARPVALSLNFDMVKAELDPAGKEAAVKYLIKTDQTGSTLAYVGKGSDDAPALSSADVGISFHTLCCYEALTPADIVITDDNISKVPYLLKAAKKADIIMKQNIGAAILVNALVLLLGITGGAGLWFAIAAEAVLYAAVLLNGIRSMN